MFCYDSMLLCVFNEFGQYQQYWFGLLEWRTLAKLHTVALGEFRFLYDCWLLIAKMCQDSHALNFFSFITLYSLFLLLCLSHPVCGALLSRYHTCQLVFLLIITHFADLHSFCKKCHTFEWLSPQIFTLTNWVAVKFGLGRGFGVQNTHFEKKFSWLASLAYTQFIWKFFFNPYFFLCHN